MQVSTLTYHMLQDLCSHRGSVAVGLSAGSPEVLLSSLRVNITIYTHTVDLPIQICNIFYR